MIELIATVMLLKYLGVGGIVAILLVIVALVFVASMIEEVQTTLKGIGWVKKSEYVYAELYKTRGE